MRVVGNEDIFNRELQVMNVYIKDKRPKSAHWLNQKDEDPDPARQE